MRSILETIMRSILAFIFIPIYSSIAFAYSPPIGIPDPGLWGTTHPIDSAAPDTATKCPNWPGSATTGCYYIDNSVTCSDVSTYGYPNLPRCNPANVTYAAGSYIEIHGGPYTGIYQWSFSGTSANPVWVHGDSTTRPTFTGEIRLGGLQGITYTILENLNFNSGVNSCITVRAQSATPSNNFAIRNSNFSNRTQTGDTAALGTTPDLGATMHDVVIYNNTFSDLGDWENVVDDDFHGYNPTLWSRDATTYQYNVWFLDNDCSYVSGDCIQINGGTWGIEAHENLHHIYVGNNTAHHNRQSGIYTKQAKDVVISSNVVHDMYAHGTQQGICYGILYTPDNYWLINNECYTSNHGVRQGDCKSWASGAVDCSDVATHNQYFIGNVFHDIKYFNGTDNSADYFGCAIKFYYGPGTMNVIDNTFYDVRLGYVNYNAGGTTNLSGNIIKDVILDHLYLSSNATDDVNIDYSDLYDTDGLLIQWGATAYTSMATFQGLGQCTNCLTDDPLFVSASDLRLQSNSQAIGAGVEDAAYDTFFTLYGIDIQKDRAGSTRPLNTTWDIGAYEYNEATAPQSRGTVPLGNMQ